MADSLMDERRKREEGGGGLERTCEAQTTARAPHARHSPDQSHLDLQTTQSGCNLHETPRDLVWTARGPDSCSTTSFQPGHMAPYALLLQLENKSIFSLSPLPQPKMTPQQQQQQHIKPRIDIWGRPELSVSAEGAVRAPEWKEGRTRVFV